MSPRPLAKNRNAGRRAFVGEQQRPQGGELDAALRLRMHEHVADRLARYEQPAGADQDQPRDPLGMTHRQLGGDPAADAMTDQIETLQPERVEDLEVMEQDVVDAAAVGSSSLRAHPGCAGAITRAALPSRR